MCGSEEKVELYVGIIDILQEYTILKRIESAAKGLIRGKVVNYLDIVIGLVFMAICIQDVSVADPKKYRKRFEAFLSEVVLHRWGIPTATFAAGTMRKKSAAIDE